jgi:hypothetical protein
MTAVLITGVAFALKAQNFYALRASAVTENQANASLQANLPLPPPPPQKLTNPPEIIKAVYVTGYSASTKYYLNYLRQLFKNTEINAVVLDIKGSDGKTGLYNTDDVVRFFHNQNIYVIGRIAVFEDPTYSKIRPELAIYNKAKTTDPKNPVLWLDNNGLSWMDPSSKDVWDYNISLAKDAFYNHGFDEVNFDYVRFPTDGNAKNMGFPVYDEKTPISEVIKNFFQYVRANLAGEKISVDLFGLTTVNSDDMGIGQIIENAFANFDYVSPMVYPSHYANGFIGFVNPAEHPYEVIKYSLDSAVVKQKAFATSAEASASQAKLRPWLQDFNMGAEYNADMVKLEIKATQDSLQNDYNGFMLWNPSNVYTQAAVLNPN